MDRIRLSRRAVVAGLPIGAVGLGLVGVARPWPAAARQATPAATPSTGPTPSLSIGLIPGEEVETQRKLYQPLLDHIEAELAVEKLEVFIGPDYTAVIEAMRGERLDVARFGPFSYVLAHQVAGAVPLVAAGTADGQPGVYYSLIVVRADSGIADLEALRGRSIAFNDPASTSGHLFPRFMLLQAGIDPDRDMEAQFAGTGDATLLALKNGRVDAATTADRALAEAIEEGFVADGELVIVAESDPIPRSPFSTSPDLDPGTRERLKQAFLAFHELGGQGVEELLKDEQGERYVEVTDELYDSVRRVAGELDLDIESLG